MGRVEKFISQEQYDKALNLLAQRPGIFSRRLDELLGKIEDHEKILQIFEQVASKVSIKVLLSLKGYFQKRHEKLKIRVFIIKGTNTKMYFKSKVKEKLDLELCEKVCNICSKALMSHFENKPKMNNVYLSEDLKKQLIPLDMRNSNNSLETYIKGSRFDISYNKLTNDDHEMIIKELEEEINQYEQKIANNNLLKVKLQELDNKEQRNTKIIEKKNMELNDKIENVKMAIEEHRNDMKMKEVKVIRLFIWWTNTRNKSVDIDLSVQIFDEDLNSLSHVSFNFLKNDIFKIYHSGDIIDGGDVHGDGVAEFIDFDPKQVVDNGGRYILVGVISYCGLKFKELEHCKFGWMERDDFITNELFEPKTVKQRLDLNSDSTSTVPVVFDCKTNEFIWIDTTLTNNERFVNIEHSETQMKSILFYYLNPLRDNLYNLINLHVQSREGHLVDSIDKLSKGDIAFVSALPYKCIEGVKYVRPVDLDIIISEYMTE